MELQLGGPIVLKKYIQTLSEHIYFHKKSIEQELQQQSKSDEESKENVSEMQENINIMKKNVIKTAAEKLYASISLENSDQTRFVGVIKTLNQQKLFWKCSVSEHNS